MEHCSETLTSSIYNIPSEWMTGGPEQPNHIPKQLHRRDTWRKKRRGDRGVYVLSRPSAAVRSASRVSPDFVSRGIRERQISLSDARSPAIRRSGTGKV